VEDLLPAYQSGMGPGSRFFGIFGESGRKFAQIGKHMKDQYAIFDSRNLTNPSSYSHSGAQGRGDIILFMSARGFGPALLLNFIELS
jgi:hypothetical protein